jgi:hypothetical protein
MKILAIRLTLFFLIILIFGCIYTYEISDSEIPNVPNKNEIVMSKGMKITATTPEGTIIVTAGNGLKKSYTWEGDTRSVIMWPRGERWYGSMGLYYPGPGNHWKEHNGITRSVVQEGQQHFDTAEEALEWLKLPRHNSCVHNDNGLVVCSKSLSRKQLNVDVWQIFIGGKIISENQEDIKRIEEDWQRFHERFLKASEYARLRKICHIGGEKPKSLPGSQDEKIKVEFVY